jgi:hypothetical protein
MNNQIVMKTLSEILVFILMTYLTVNAQEGKTINLTGPYLGQTPPGVIPEIFAKGIISTEGNEFSCCFSPDGNEFYFSGQDPESNQTVVMVSKLSNGVWKKPVPEPALLPERFTFEPFVTPDNKRLYFQTAGVVNGKPEMMTKYLERTERGWGEIKDPGPSFNPGKTMHITATMDGTIYTTDISGSNLKSCRFAEK